MEKYDIFVTQGNITKSILAVKDSVLSIVLNENGFDIPVSCGGNGTCGKCLVEIEGKGDVLACQYKIISIIKVKVPKKKKALILDGFSDKLKTFPITDGKTGYGIAIDIGTTTVVLYLADLSTGKKMAHYSFLNPQKKYGDDVVSRIKFTEDNSDGLDILANEIRTRINNGIKLLLEDDNIELQDLKHVVIAANPTMLHLFAAVNPSSIAAAPYELGFKHEKKGSPQDFGLELDSNTKIRLLPSIAAYIGSDVVVGITSLKENLKGKYSLLLDLGTNGEMALVSEDKIYCCSTAAGPAFEGGNIKCGIGGVEGAISDYKNGEFKTINDKPAIGICGSGLADIISELLRTEIINKSGYMENDFSLYKNAGENIFLSPKDVREVQLAKAAVYAGMEILLKEANTSFDELENIYIAGGFGNYIKIDSAIDLGLLPRGYTDKIVSIGNSAGYGAYYALLSKEFNKEMNKIIKKTEYIELSMRSDFNMAYVEQMSFS